eukprot:Gregarina_sp_Pseudo_9__319@NODE_1206_length_1779_cov_47_167241_g1132_i0_p1_GENE_NODE_1206_length_1779_cov_47_167241_g1132_i0NODE_1206_length_1779_cov_47_167241_g1132_i0_p1_ORF_typecomplete_len274_score6_75CDC73_C/PF05179_14/1_9e09_NODE_1206_length_1779_cov_47_167241_g1132_i064885
MVNGRPISGLEFLLDSKTPFYLSGIFDLGSIRPLSSNVSEAPSAAQSLCDEIDSILSHANIASNVQATEAAKDDLYSQGSESGANRAKPSLSTYLTSNNMTPIVLFPSEDIQPPFKSLLDFQHFVVYKTLPKIPSVSRLETSFAVEIPHKKSQAPLIIKFVDTSQLHKFTSREWHSVIGIFVTGYKSLLARLPMESYQELGKCWRIFYTQWDDEVPIPTFLSNVPFSPMRFSQGSRHNDKILWLDMVEQLARRLEASYDFTSLRSALNRKKTL